MNEQEQTRAEEAHSYFYLNRSWKCAQRLTTPCISLFKKKTDPKIQTPGKRLTLVQKLPS